MSPQEKKKTRLCAFSVHNNYTLARDRSPSLLFSIISLSVPATLLFRIHSLVESLCPYLRMLDTQQSHAILIPFFPFFVP